MTSTPEARPAPCSSTFYGRCIGPFNLTYRGDDRYWQREAEDSRGPLSHVMEIDDCYSFYSNLLFGSKKSVPFHFHLQGGIT